MKKKIINFLKFLAALFLLGVVVYFMGPKPAPPVFALPKYTPAGSLTALESEVQASEAAEPGIKPDCKAQIVWADSTKKEKTKLVFLYFHGFGASREEGAPVHEEIARQYGANLYLARLDEHGVEEGENNMLELTADSYVESGEKALHIAQQLGDSVVILATSAGGGLSLFLASRHPEIKALVTWSPCIRLFSGLSGVLAGPWGLTIAQKTRGGLHNDWPFKKPGMAKYWTTHQRFEGIVQFSTFLETALVPETFAKVKCPVFVGYYYKDEENQDKVVSVAAMQEMFGQLGTPPALKREMAFPNTNNHVIACHITSDDWKGVEYESSRFLQEIVGLVPVK